MTDIVIRPRADEKYDIYVHSEDGEPLLNSSQGYSRAADAEDIARKTFGGSEAIEKLATIRRLLESITIANDVGDLGPLLNDMLTASEPVTYEPARLTVEYRDGRVKSEVLR